MAPQKVIVFGATGATGLNVVEQALAAGHEVTVFVRTPGKLPESIKSASNLKEIQGSFSDKEGLTAALQGQDVVISLIGPRNPLNTSGTTFPTIYRAILDAMRAASVSRIYALSTFSLQDEHDKSSILRSLLVWFIWTVAHNGWKEFVGIGDVFEKEGQGLEWTVFRVGWLLNGDREREALAGYVADGKTNLHVRRSEIARWLVGEVGRGGREWIGKRPGLSSRVRPKVD